MSSVLSAAIPARAQFLRFALVGCAGFVVDAGVLYAVLALGADRYTGRILSYLAAATFTWALNRHYTFRAQRSARLLTEWGLFLAANAVGGLINWTIYAFLVSVSPFVFAHPVVGVAAGSIAGLVVNFTLSRHFVFGVQTGARRIDWTLVALPLISLLFVLGATVNPWPRDGWFETQYFLFGHYTGYDDYAPVSAPALLFRLGHAIAVIMGIDLAGEFYVGAILQNLLVLLSACFVYFALKSMRLAAMAGPVAIALLLSLLAMNLPQAFYSESIVIFLMAGVMWTVVVLPSHAETGGARFWLLTLACGVLVGLLVLTRMTPIFLIPAIALLFFRRMPWPRVAQVTGVAVGVTVLFMGATLFANHARFGRYELTNSSGRHLWQGVKDLSDDSHLRGLNWWEVPPAGLSVVADPRDPVLGALSKEVIREKPAQYLLHGAKKFASTILVPPYYFGTGGNYGHANPLNRTALLPSMAASMHVGVYERALRGVMRRLYVAFEWIYPVTILAIMVTWAVCLWRRDRIAGKPLLSFYSFLALLFFGSLWFSWQVEIENSRNAVPYLPLWAMLLAMTVDYWAVRPRESR